MCRAPRADADADDRFVSPDRAAAPANTAGLDSGKRRLGQVRCFTSNDQLIIDYVVEHAKALRRELPGKISRILAECIDQIANAASPQHAIDGVLGLCRELADGVRGARL